MISFFMCPLFIIAIGSRARFRYIYTPPISLVLQPGIGQLAYMGVKVVGWLAAVSPVVLRLLEEENNWEWSGDNERWLFYTMRVCVSGRVVGFECYSLVDGDEEVLLGKVERVWAFWNHVGLFLHWARSEILIGGLRNCVSRGNLIWRLKISASFYYKICKNWCCCSVFNQTSKQFSR